MRDIRCTARNARRFRQAPCGAPNAMHVPAGAGLKAPGVDTMEAS